MLTNWVEFGKERSEKLDGRWNEASKEWMALTDIGLSETDIAARIKALVESPPS